MTARDTASVSIRRRSRSSCGANVDPIWQPVDAPVRQARAAADHENQLARFAHEVVPAVRNALD
jgi:hypothetical protein